jgi:excisionase family DNA binding protein
VAQSELHNERGGDEILSAVEVAQELRCSKAHIYNVILGRVEGVTPLPAICMGRRRLIRRSALEAWKRGNEQVAARDRCMEATR